MKAKKMFLTMAVVFSMVAIFVVSAHAGTWALAKVEQAGAGAGNHVYVKISSVSGSPSSFQTGFYVALDARKKEILATALTAMTLGTKVSVELSNTTSGSVILSMYVHSE